MGHPALAASTRARVAAYPGRPEVALVAHDLAFDAALGIVAWYLSTGGTLVMARHDERLDPELLGALIGRHRVGQLDIVPSHYRLLLDLVRGHVGGRLNLLPDPKHGVQRIHRRLRHQRDLDPSYLLPELLLL